MTWLLTGIVCHCVLNAALLIALVHRHPKRHAAMTRQARQAWRRATAQPQRGVAALGFALAIIGLCVIPKAAAQALPGAALATFLTMGLRRRPFQQLDVTDGLAIALGTMASLLAIAGVGERSMHVSMTLLGAELLLLCALALRAVPLVFAAVISHAAFMVLALVAYQVDRGATEYSLMITVVRALALPFAIAAWRNHARARDTTRPAFRNVGGPTLPVA